MNVKPKYDSTAIKMSPPVKKEFSHGKFTKDPQHIIPNGIYKVIRWEILMQRINALLAFIFFIAATTIIILYAAVYESSWPKFIIPVLFLIASFYKLVISIMEHSRINRETNRYREDLKLNLASQPPLIIRIYRNTHVKQVRHNWATFFIILNGGIFTLVLWWLKDASWWIFDFKTWVRELFWNPDAMTILFASGLLLVLAIHILLAIKRKKSIFAIESYWGETLVAPSEIDELKQKYNKAYRRMFITYIMVILIIPICVRFAIKWIRRK